MKREEFTHGDVVTLKLVSGEEIIGRYDEADDEFVFMEKPLTLMPNPQGLGMTQSLFSMDMAQLKPVAFRKTAIIAQAFTKKDLAGHYLTNTSQIQVASAKGILMG